jgi:hypothetical protein
MTRFAMQRWSALSGMLFALMLGGCAVETEPTNSSDEAEGTARGVEPAQAVGPQREAIPETASSVSTAAARAPDSTVPTGARKLTPVRIEPELATTPQPWQTH